SPARIACRGLHVNFVERSLVQHLVIRHAVEAHAAGYAQSREPGLALHVTSHRDHHIFSYPLQAGRHVCIILIKPKLVGRGWIGNVIARGSFSYEPAPWISRGPKQIREQCREGPSSMVLKTRVSGIEPQTSIISDLGDLPDLIDVFCLPERCH